MKSIDNTSCLDCKNCQMLKVNKDSTLYSCRLDKAKFDLEEKTQRECFKSKSFIRKNHK